jgi:hypothetical protein
MEVLFPFQPQFLCGFRDADTSRLVHVIHETSYTVVLCESSRKLIENGEKFHLLNTVHLARLFQAARFTAQGLVSEGQESNLNQNVYFLTKFWGFH